MKPTEAWAVVDEKGKIIFDNFCDLYIIMGNKLKAEKWAEIYENATVKKVTIKEASK